MRRILAIGGFSNDESELLAATHIRDLTEKAQPKVCFLSTPAGDAPTLINHVDGVFGKLGCETSNISFFGGAGRHCVRPEDAAAHLLQQDAVFVSGGNPRAALALWREWKLDAALNESWKRGVLLSGMSAGAVCWFEHHVPPPEHRSLPLYQCLGFLRGNCEVHYHAGDGSRREETMDTTSLLALSPAIAIDDDAAVLFEGGTIASVVSWREGATAYRLEVRPDALFECPLVVTPKVIGSIAATSMQQPVCVDLSSKQACLDHVWPSAETGDFPRKRESAFVELGRQ